MDDYFDDDDDGDSDDPDGHYEADPECVVCGGEGGWLRVPWEDSWVWCDCVTFADD